MNGLAAYQASKWGLRGLNKAAAMELGHRGIRVNAIFPGPISSDGAVAFVGRADQALSRHTGWSSGGTDRGRPASLFLASDEASYIMGAELTVDGGYTVGSYVNDMAGAPPEVATGR